MANLEVENGSILSRATPDSALHHSVQQKINDSKQKNLLTLNNKPQRKPESVSKETIIIRTQVNSLHPLVVRF